MFNNSTNGYSLADIAAATGNDTFGGNGNSWFLILFIILLFGGYGNGWGNGLFGGQGSTGSGITDGYILTSDFANIERKIDGVNNGLCDGFYAMNTSLLNGFSGVNSNLSNQTASLTAQMTALGNQMGTCCCDLGNKVTSGFSDLNYRLAEQSCQTRQAIADSTRTITANQDANTRAILDFMTQDKIATLQAENQSLKFAASQCEQNAYLVNQLRPSPAPAYVVPNPYCNCACNNGCGC